MRLLHYCTATVLLASACNAFMCYQCTPPARPCNEQSICERHESDACMKMARREHIDGQMVRLTSHLLTVETLKLTESDLAPVEVPFL